MANVWRMYYWWILKLVSNLLFDILLLDIGFLGNLLLGNLLLDILLFFFYSSSDPGDNLI
jgi:hypothetical protein